MNKQPDSLGFLIGDVQRLMRRQFQQQLEGSCLTLAQARALVHIARREGIRQVELADGGTLFLDEIGLLPYNLQSKFLQLIQCLRRH